MMAWNCCWASASQAVAPAGVRLMLTVHWPVWLSWALADLIWEPVSPAGPRT